MISCYTYVNDELPRIRAIKPKTKIETISFRITGIDNKDDLKEYNQIVKEKMDKSGLFQAVNVLDVNEKLDKADKHHLEIHLKPIDVFENRWLYGVSYIPFLATALIPFPIPIPGLIPAFKQNKLSMLVDYYVDGKLKRYDKFYQSSTTLVGIIPLVLRVKNGDSVEKPEQNIISNFTDNTLFYLNELNFSESAQ